MNYTKKSKPIGNNPLQHSTRSSLKFISWKEKESGRGNGRTRDRLLEQNRKRAYQCIDEFNDSDTDDDDHNIVDNTDSLVGNLTNQSAASVVYSYSDNAYCSVKKESV